MKSQSQKVEEAKKRQEEYDKLTPSEKIARLDARFGKGIGAVKERAKILGKTSQ